MSKTSFLEVLRLKEFFNVDAVRLFKNPLDAQDRLFVRFLGKDKRGRIQIDTFRIHPEIEALRYGRKSAYASLSKKQFKEMFGKYKEEFVGYLNDDEWESFIESSYYNYLFQKFV